MHSSNGQFGSEEVVPLSGGNSNSPPTPAPTPNPTPGPTPTPTPNPTSAPVQNPTPAPVSNPTPAPVQNPTSPPINSPTDSCTGHEFRLELETDQWGEEVNWQLEDPSGNVVVQGGNYPPGENSVAVTECLSSDGVHSFKIMDLYGDGMCCGTNYTKSLEFVFTSCCVNSRFLFL